MLSYGKLMPEAELRHSPLCTKSPSEATAIAPICPGSTGMFEVIQVDLALGQLSLPIDGHRSKAYEDARGRSAGVRSSTEITRGLWLRLITILHN